MKTIYEAFDGTQFDDEFTCTDYEWKKEHEQGLKDISFRNFQRQELIDKFSEDTYRSTYYIDITSEEGLRTLHKLADYTGYCSYEDPDSVGSWIWNEDKGEFIHA